MTMSTFRSLDLFSKESCRQKTIDETLSNCSFSDSPYSIRGAANSITAAWFGSGTTILDYKPSSPKLEFDEVRRCVSVSASLTVSQLQTYLVKKRFSLSGLPSYPNVTIGGCIAANVHGQNHFKEGCFGRGVIGLRLFHPKYGEFTASPTTSSDVFSLTVGGFGLTGIILEVTLAVVPINSNILECRLRKFDNLYMGYQLMAREVDDYDYFHSWVDLSNLKTEGERGFYYASKYQSCGEMFKRITMPSNPTNRHFKIKPNLLGSRLCSVVNKLYWYTNTRAGTKISELTDFIFPSKNRLWYFSMFGKAGLIEHQVLVANESVEEYLKDLRKLLRKWNPIISLCHIKLFRGNQSLLNFDGNGLCLAMHFARNATSLQVLDRIDDLDNEYSAFANIIKDSRLRKEVVAHQYPEYEEFSNRIHEYDKEHVFQNTISQRLLSQY